MRTGGVRRESVSFIFRSMSKSATRSPFREISTCSALGGLVVAEDFSETPVIEGDDDHVLRVGGEMMPYHEATAGPERRSLDVAELRDRLGHDIGLDRG